MYKKELRVKRRNCRNGSKHVLRNVEENTTRDSACISKQSYTYYWELSCQALISDCVTNLLYLIEPRSHDDLPSVPTPPRIDSTSYFLPYFIHYIRHCTHHCIHCHDSSIRTTVADLAGWAGNSPYIERQTDTFFM
jgi:hypothetical protein